MSAVRTPWGLAPDFTRIPEALRTAPRWGLFVGVPQPDGKVAKVPKQAAKPTLGASINAPSHWSTFETAAAAYRRNAGAFSGVGFVLTRADGFPASDIIAVDLDHCVDALGTISDMAQAIVHTFDTYAELSPSGTGLRMFLHGTLPGPSINNKREGVELYDGVEPRYVTVTGYMLDSSPQHIATPTPDVLAEIYERYKGKDEPTDVTKAPVPELPAEATCAKLQLDASTALSGDVAAFWREGEVRDRFPSRSEAIQAAFTDLFTQDWTAPAVYAAAYHNKHVFGRYLDRRGDVNRAAIFLWADIQRAQAYTAAHVRTVGADAFDDLTVGEAKVEARKTNIISAMDAMAPRSVEWVVKHQVERGYIGELFGPANVGKSAIALDLAARIATGLCYAHHKVMTGDVLYVAGEGYAGLGRRLKGWSLQHQLVPSRVFLTRSAVPLSEKRAITLLLDDVDANWVEPVLIVIDTLSRNYGPGSENDDETMRAFVSGLERLRDHTGAAIMVVHHTGHSTTERSRGHSSFYAALDYSLRVEADKKELGLVRMSCAKMKDHPYPADMGYTLRPVALGLADDDGEAITGVVALERDVSVLAAKFEGKADVTKALKTHEHDALKALLSACQLEGEAAPEDAYEQGAKKVVRVEVWREAFYQTGRADTRETARKNFLRARAALAREGLATFTDDEVFAWVTELGATRLAGSVAPI